MPQVSREGHRERIRSKYLQNPEAEMDDRSLLELLLTYAIPRKDVKPTAYALLNEFETLENIINAGVDELSTVSGIGKNSAILIMLIKKFHTAIDLQKSRKPKNLNDTKIVVDYVMKKIGSESTERFIAITLNNDGELINCHNISDGEISHAFVDKAKLIRKVLNDHASAVIIAHNHPSGRVEPSVSDTNTTIEILNILRTLNIRLLDHIIVSKTKAFCMSASLEYADYFD